MDENKYNFNSNVDEQNGVNSGLDTKRENVSSSFDFNRSTSINYEESDMNRGEENEYNNGRQVNRAKSLVKSFTSSRSNGFPVRQLYGFRNNGLRGYVSVLGIAIILGILVLIISFFAN